MTQQQQHKNARENAGLPRHHRHDNVLPSNGLRRNKMAAV
jgi:hypothetical protein